MNSKRPQDESSKVQVAIYDVALSLDSYLLNGIPYGVLQQAVFPGFLEKTAASVLRDLANLEKHAPEASITSHSRVAAALATLRAKCQELIELVTSLSSFRTLPMRQLRSAVSHIPVLRGECVQLLQELEVCFRTPRPFYESRPSHSTDSVNVFLANMLRVFEEARTAEHAEAK